MASRTSSNPSEVIIYGTIDRAGIQGIDEKTDKEIIIDWLKAARSSGQNPDPLHHLLWDALFRKLEEQAGPDFTITRAEHVMIMFALARANFSPDSTLMCARLFNMFGLGI